MKKLTPQREVFAQELAKGKTQTACLRIAFPSCSTWTLGCVYSRASEIANDPRVMARVEQIKAPALRRLEVKVERIVEERSYGAFINIADCFDDEGRPKSLHDLPEHVQRGIAGWKIGKEGIEIKLAKDAHLTALEKHLGMYAEDGGKSVVLNIQINRWDGGNGRDAADGRRVGLVEENA